MQPTYDRIARYYDSAFRPFERWFLSRWRSETLALLPPEPDVLELGAGTGANFALYPKCRHAVATDLSHEMLIRAREKSTAIDLVQSDAQLLPFTANRFDAAFATLVFCSMPDPDVAFAELIRVVKPGGRIVLLEHVRPPGVLGWLFDVLSFATVTLIDDHFNRRTAEIAAGSGLDVVEVRSKALGIVNLIVCDNNKSVVSN